MEGGVIIAILRISTASVLISQNLNLFINQSINANISNSNNSSNNSSNMSLSDEVHDPYLDYNSS